MGIHGLTSFIDNNSHLLKDHRLHDCKVVIDGNNFYHFLYYYCNVRCQFGGDYDTYHRKIKMIFNMFKSCAVEVFVVFDGAYTVDGRKFKTTFGRARDRVNASQRVMHGQNGKLLPCLAQQTFRQALDDLGIQHVTSDFEADNQLATLANLWNCPVISNDSDFYIFELTGGFIPLDYIDFRPRHLPEESSETGQPITFLPVQFYHADEFIKCFKSLNRSVLPLFATMQGNDYVNAAAFEAFYQKKTPKIASRRYSASKKHQKIVSVLYWLEEKSYKGSEELVSQVLSFIKEERRQQVEKLLTESINDYRDTHEFESFDLRRFLEGDKSAAEEKTEDVMDINGQCLPSWFITACRCGDLPPFLLNAVLLHCVILPIQVESISLPAAAESSRNLREVIYGLLLGKESALDNNEMHKNQDPTQQSELQTSPSHTVACKERDNSDHSLDDTSDSSSSGTRSASPVRKEVGTEVCQNTSARKKSEGILEYTRYHKQLRRIMVQPCSAMSTFGSLPPLGLISSFSQHDRQTILMETLGVSARFVEKFHPALQLYLMCLVVWARKAEPPVSLHHVKGVLLSAVLLHIHRDLQSRETQLIHDNTSHSDSAMQDTSAHQCEDFQAVKSGDMHALSIADVCSLVEDKILRKVKDNLQKYHHDPVKISSKNPPEQALFHGSCQFQACVLDAVHLNSLLCCPLPNLRPAILFNGTFVYAIVRELTMRANADLFLAEMLVKGSPMVALFDSLCAEVVQEIGKGVLASNKPQGKKCCKGAKRRKKKDEEQTTVDDSTFAEGQCELEVEASCDLSNRFGVLMAEENF